LDICGLPGILAEDIVLSAPLRTNHSGVDMHPVRRSLSLLLFATTLCATAQTTVPSRPKAQTTAHAQTAQPTLPKNIPAVAAPMKTGFALRYQEIQVGTGDLAAPGQFYTVHYTGWLASDGTKFDSSVDRGQPFEFLQGTKRVIIGWDQGFEGMHVGGKRRLFIPYQLAYGEQGRPPVIPPKSDLIFDIELIAQRNPFAPPPAPATPQPSTPPPATTAPPATTTPKPQ
jgi:peptidylprolyl isomerase